ncbi:reverse transcriptase domain-containing protein [Tanacetum coccineum]|uniref:Reverse transcriptase domain-containing protein n=1 Tax=Tanacetum coccineum TaxID=301880 RepID=A0ABQ5AA95_9ASTR
MGCCLTSWFSKKQTALAISTTEAEYVSAGKACQQAIWIKQALIDYGVRRTRSSSNLIVESSTTPKRHNRRRSKQRVEPFSLEENPVVMMADQRTIAELLQAPTKGYGDAFVIPVILAENFELKHGLINLVTSKQFYEFEKEDPNATIPLV